MRQNLNIFYTQYAHSGVDIFLLSETWSSSDFIPPPLIGYYSFISPSTHGKAGGVVIYIRDYITFSKIDVDHLIKNDSFCEFMLLHSISHHANILLLYRHPNTNPCSFFISLDNILSSFYCCKQNYVNMIIGDFNINRLNFNSHAKKLNEIILSHNLSSLIDTPTFSTSLSTSCIDHLYVSKSFSDFTSVEVIDDSIGDHHTVSVNLPYQSKHYNNHQVKRIHSKKKD